MATRAWVYAFTKFSLEYYVSCKVHFILGRVKEMIEAASVSIVLWHLTPYLASERGHHCDLYFRTINLVVLIVYLQFQTNTDVIFLVQGTT